MLRLRHFTGVFVLITALIVRQVFSTFPDLYESWYLQGLFPRIRLIQYKFSDILPIPGYYLLALLLLLWLAGMLISTFQKKGGWARKGLYAGRKLLNMICWVAAIFLVLWGFNYVNIGLAHRMKLETNPDKTMLADMYLWSMAHALEKRSAIGGIEELETVEDLLYPVDEGEILGQVRSVLHPLGYATEAPLVVRYLQPEGILLRLSISGIYNPFTGEANVEQALGPLKKTFTTAHEMAHAMGVTGEAEANFTAWLACSQSADPLAQYAAAYVLWRHLGSEVNKAYEAEAIAALASHIPEALRKDREAIWKNQNRYKGYFPEVSYALNDTYLKVQGVEAGADDYDLFVDLWFDWMHTHGLMPELQSAIDTMY